MAIEPELLRALERSLMDDPGNRALRLHVVDLLLQDGQGAAALGHCEILLATDPQDREARSKRDEARQRLGLGGADAAREAEPDARPEAEPEAEGGPTPPSAVDDLAEMFRPALTLDEVAGMEHVKERLRLGFLEPMRNEELRRSFGHELRSSLLLWGPPGCGKTFLAKALAGELGLYFIHVGIADILEMWMGSSERNLREVFNQARLLKPTVLFIDELDALGHKRAHLRTTGTRNVVNQLLLELDGAETDNEGILVLGATNQPWDIDPALVRPGRFDRQILIVPPDRPARLAILTHHLKSSLSTLSISTPSPVAPTASPGPISPASVAVPWSSPCTSRSGPDRPDR